MDLFSPLLLGFAAVLTPLNLVYCLLGAAIGTLIGVLPGIGPVATMALLLPVTFGLPPLSALIMLAGIFYGAQYGGSTTAILANIPGEASSVVTCLDGYAMAKQGRAATALVVSAVGSFFAGCVATLVVAVFAPWLAQVAIEFGPAENFSLMVLGLLAAVVLARGSLLKATAMVCLGILLGLVGTDVNTGEIRFTFGIPDLADGISFVVVAMGMFGLAEVIVNLERPETRAVLASRLERVRVRLADLRAAVGPILRGTALGTMLGVLPGGGAVLGSFAAYTLEKRLARDPGRFGCGAIEGVAAPESANNAAAQSSFIPLLTLGIPPNAVMALMVGAMTIQGIAPGPMVIKEHPTLFWGLVASMWIGNLMLLVLNLPLIGIWVRLLTVPYRLLYPAIVLFCSIGVFGINNSVFDVMLTALFGLLGYVFAKLGCEPAPLLLGFVLGSMMEENLRRAMLLAHGDPSVFVTRPLSLAVLLVAAALLAGLVLPAVRATRKEAFQQ